MYTWYAKVLMLSGEYIYVAIRDVKETSSIEVVNKYFGGTTNSFNNFCSADPNERVSVYIQNNKIQAFWISDKPFN